MEQTAVTWLEKQLKKQKEILKNHFEEGKWNDDRCDEIDNCLALLQSALEMEKRQIIEAITKTIIGSNVIYDQKSPEVIHAAEEYYAETFGKD